jgi:ferredoxin-NADP reductase
MSMLRYLRDTGDKRPVWLVCGNRTAADIVFKSELDRMPENVRVTHVLSEASPAWMGARGRVTREIIEAHAGEALPEAHVYVCGPPPMMDMVIRSLKSLGVSPSRIHYERFAL